MEGHTYFLFSLNKDTSLSEDNFYTNRGLVNFRLGCQIFIKKIGFGWEKKNSCRIGPQISKWFVLFHPSDRGAQHSKPYREQRDEGTVVLSMYALVWLIKIAKCRHVNCLPKPDGESNPSTVLQFDHSFSLGSL